MPRKPPTIAKRETYSRDLKRRVIYQANTLGYSNTEIALSLNIKLRVVQRVRKRYEDTGEVCADRTYTGRRPVLSPGATEVRELQLSA